ncbi:MAG: hypothetical protein EA349_13245 [Halomonadaceae bacterium]|nr:MAG: hypothetical protein EA349_13245 [Halomonadaceae bacterium]
MGFMSEHFFAWVIYYLAFVVVYAYWARLMRILPLRFLRQVFKGLLAVPLLTPVMSSVETGWWSPAWLHFAYSALLGNEAEMGRALFSLFLGSVFLLAILALDSGWYHWRRRR